MTGDVEHLADLVAQRVAERLFTAGDHGPVLSFRSHGPRVLTAREVAERLGRSVDWVREHRGELGLVPGPGARPRLLFNAEAVEAWATAGDAASLSATSRNAETPIRSRRRRFAPIRGDDLLPIRGGRRLT